ncbi:MAG: hypothetical protein AAGA21_03840 [Pseudomonadota bacterium]
MGHHRLGRLPASKLWRQVVSELGSGADLNAVAAAVAKAAESNLKSASGDPAFLHAFWLLTQIPLAARGPDFVGDLRRLDVDVPDGPHLFDVTAALSESVDAHSRGQPGRTDLGEMAKLAAVETLSTMVGRDLPSLFSPSPDEVRKSIGRFASGDNFSKLARDFFAGLTQRSLHYYLSRELSNHIGPGDRFADDGQQVAFNQALDRHCREVSRIIETFAGGWYGKNVYQGDGLTPDDVRRFAPIAFKKIRAELGKRSDVA